MSLMGLLHGYMLYLVNEENFFLSLWR